MEQIPRYVPSTEAAQTISLKLVAQGMAMKNPVPQFAHFVSELKLRHPNLAYLHVVEARISGNIERGSQILHHESNGFLRSIWNPLTYISAGGYDRESAINVAETTDSLITFGRHFLSNVRTVEI
jgi:NADPH2 dehydrogenase